MTLAIERNPELRRGAAMSSARLDALAALPAMSDDEIGVRATPTLGLTDADVQRIRELSQAWHAAKQQAVAAEQVFTSAGRVAAQLAYHQARAGEQAARALMMNGHGKAMAADVVEGIDTAKHAASALPALEREVRLARDHAARARAALHQATTSAIKAALRRAAEEYGRLALEQTRALASLDACVQALPSHAQVDLVSPLSVFRQHWCLPALPAQELNVPPDRAAAPGRFVPLVAAHDHPRNVAHTRAASGWLQQQLTEALGFDPRTLLG